MIVNSKFSAVELLHYKSKLRMETCVGQCVVEIGCYIVRVLRII